MNKRVIGGMIAFGGIVLFVIISFTYEINPQENKEFDELNPKVEELQPTLDETKNLHKELNLISDKIKSDSAFVVYTNVEGIINAYDTEAKEIKFSGFDATTIIENSMNALDSNREHKQMVTIIGNYTISSTLDIPSKIIIFTL